MINRADINFLETVGIAAIALGTAYVSYKIGYLKASLEARKETCGEEEGKKES